MNQQLLKLWKDNKAFIVFICLMFVFRSAVADWNSVPTGSMKPTILEGDRILVNKMAYDLRLPFTHLSLLKRGDPVRGDIIVFDSRAAGKRLVKRAIGVPGDIVEMRNNVVFINGQQLRYDTQSIEGYIIEQTEDLLGVQHKVWLRRGGSRVSSFSPVMVPAGHYLAMGDNRDDSGDSRMIGFVPREEIIGRSKSVVMSFNYDNYFIPRSDRFLQPL